MTRRDKKLLILAAGLLIVVMAIVAACGGLHNEKPDADQTKTEYASKAAEKEPTRQQETVTLGEVTLDIERLYEQEESSSDIDDNYSGDPAVMADKETEALHTYPIGEVGNEQPDSYSTDIDINIYSGSDSSDNTAPFEEIADYEVSDGRDIEDTDADGSYADVDVQRDACTAGDNNTQGLTDEEIWELARITWLEVGICDWYTQYLCASVLLNRLYNPELWNCSNLYDVIYPPGQYASAYQYTNWGEDILTISDTTWDAVYTAIRDRDPNPHFQCSYTPGYRLYYLDTKYDVYFYYFQ